MKFGIRLYDYTLDQFVYKERVICDASEIKDGWVLVSVGIENLAMPTITKIFYRVRTLNNGKDNVVEDHSLSIKQMQTDKQDYYLGGYCDLST